MAVKDSDSDVRLGVVGRVTSLLTALIDVRNGGASASQVAREAGLPVPTAHRLLAEMGENGLALRNPDTKRWTLGPVALGIGVAARKQMRLLDVVQPHLKQITDSTGETSVFVIRDGTSATYVDFVESPHRLVLRERVGMRMPLNVGASRQVILAHLPEEEREHVLAELEHSGDIPDIEDLRRLCDQIRLDGYAVTRGAITPGATGIAAPVRDANGRVIGSLMLAAPDIRCPEDAIEGFASVLVEHATTLARVLHPGIHQ